MARAKASAAKPCKFCQIAAGEAPAALVYKDGVSAAFLDWRPLALGHVLLVPLAHFAALDDLPDTLMAALAVRAKMLSRAVVAAMAAEGSFLALNNIVSQSVPHVHIHVVPRRKGDGVFAGGYVWKRVAYRDDAAREDVAARIRRAVEEG